MRKETFFNALLQAEQDPFNMWCSHSIKRDRQIAKFEKRLREIVIAQAVYTEFRADGWPFCPSCGEDELYSALMLQWNGLAPSPTLADCLAGEMRCYHCQWSSVPPSHFHRNAAHEKEAEH